MAEQTNKLWTRAEVEEAAKNGEVHFIIRNNVYSVSKFLDEHPGGHEVLVAASGRDASEEFDDVGHSLDAREMMQTYQVGSLVEHERSAEKPRPAWNSHGPEDSEQGLLTSWKLPLLLGIIATVMYSYLFG